METGLFWVMTALNGRPSCPTKTFSISSNLQLLGAMGSFFMRTTGPSCKSSWSQFFLVAGIYSTNTKDTPLDQVAFLLPCKNCNHQVQDASVSRQISRHMLALQPIRCQRVNPSMWIQPWFDGQGLGTIHIGTYLILYNIGHHSGLHLPALFPDLSTTLSWPPFHG